MNLFLIKPNKTLFKTLLSWGALLVLLAPASLIFLRLKRRSRATNSEMAIYLVRAFRSGRGNCSTAHT